MAGGHLRPQTKRAARRTAPTGVQRHIGILTIRTVILAEVQIAVINLSDKGQLVKFFIGERRTFEIVMDLSVLAIADTADVLPVPSLGNLFHE